MSESQNAKFTMYSQNWKTNEAAGTTWNMGFDPALAKNSHFMKFHSEIHTFWYISYMFYIINVISNSKKPIQGSAYDMIWYDMIWYDMIWYDMTWYVFTWDIFPYRLSLLHHWVIKNPPWWATLEKDSGASTWCLTCLWEASVYITLHYLNNFCLFYSPEHVGFREVLLKP